MAAHRSATRALARAFTSRTAAAPAARVARPFSVSAFRANAVHEKEVPIVSWPATKDGKSSIPVNPGQQAVKEEPAEPTEVVPLTAEAYEKMTPMMQKMTVYGKVIIITGGARGLGNHMARACAEAGAKALVLFDANEELGKESANELYQKTKIPVTFLKVDVRDGDAINAAVDRVVELYGCPDVLVNSAGIADSNIKAEEYDSSMFRRLIDINLTGTFLVSQAVGKKMIAHGKPGSIVLVASMSGTIHNIRVNCISPGYMDTALNRVPTLEGQKKIWRSLTPQDRLGAVDDLNGLCVFLASDASGFMTGSNVLIDGGYSCY
ncbi:NADP-dependent mannitol dehydrogenase like protein [Verticillium longisporum]|uniref:NADP-dependent mannitol dehydrogenase like protein n=1 Tax=Verticillium longisporum TaxID=100787 RepID=A0A8I2Z7D0_VERLO|nr:NADP-dependent mannitol dehydrogenase like protein [Verticillium longisporum]